MSLSKIRVWSPTVLRYVGYFFLNKAFLPKLNWGGLKIQVLGYLLLTTLPTALTGLSVQALLMASQDWCGLVPVVADHTNAITEDDVVIGLLVFSSCKCNTSVLQRKYLPFKKQFFWHCDKWSNCCWFCLVFSPPVCPKIFLMDSDIKSWSISGQSSLL